MSISPSYSVQSMNGLRERGQSGDKPLWILYILFFIIISTYALLCPYTKVEESFNMQAIHDIIKYGVKRVDLFDHQCYPGAVPRTFIGPLLIGLLSWPVRLVVKDALMAVRLTMALLGASCLAFFLDSLSRALGEWVSWWCGLLMLTQFHLLYYISRPLPNTFALYSCNSFIALIHHFRYYFVRFLFATME